MLQYINNDCILTTIKQTLAIAFFKTFSPTYSSWQQDTLQ